MAYDDFVNASDHSDKRRENIFCYSETRDGIDSNATLTITDGTIVAIRADSPEGVIDCDNNTFTIN